MGYGERRDKGPAILAMVSITLSLAGLQLRVSDRENLGMGCSFVYPMGIVR